MCVSSIEEVCENLNGSTTIDSTDACLALLHCFASLDQDSLFCFQ